MLTEWQLGVPLFAYPFCPRAERCILKWKPDSIFPLTITEAELSHDATECRLSCLVCTYIGSKMMTTAMRRRGPWFIMFLLCSCSLRMITLPPTGQSHEYDGAWLFASHEMTIWWKLAWVSWSISHGDNDSASDIQTSCSVAEFILHRSQKLNPFDSCCTFNDSVISPPSLFNATQLYLSSFSLSVLVMALSVTSSAFSLSPPVALFICFFTFSSAVHTFPEHIFPLPHRQLNIATGADSSAS